MSDALSTFEDWKVLLNLLASQPPERLLVLWEKLYPDQQPFEHVHSGFQNMLLEDHLSLQEEEELLAATAEAFTIAYAKALDEANASAESEDSGAHV